MSIKNKQIFKNNENTRIENKIQEIKKFKDLYNSPLIVTFN